MHTINKSLTLGTFLINFLVQLWRIHVDVWQNQYSIVSKIFFKNGKKIQIQQYAKDRNQEFSANINGKYAKESPNR